MLLKRRQFIQAGSLATTSLLVPRFLKAFETSQPVAKGNKVLVVIQLSGGNDGLNTVIPVRNDIYYKERPRLGISKDKALLLNDETGLHPSLNFFKELYDDGSLAILNNVGYPEPDRSHFRSMDIWQSASTSNEYISTGWIGRYLDAQCINCEKSTRALEIDDVLSMTLKGEKMKGLAMKDPKRLFNTSNEKFFRALAAQQHQAQHEQPVAYLYKTLSETVSSADYIYNQSKKYKTSIQYPSTETGHSLKTIASLILSDINTKVYYLSIGSFDTHIAQEGQQKRLFTELNAAIDSFVSDLKSNNRFEDVLLMTFSEFGRRVSQNASGGTDHGTANNIFFAGGGLKQKGLLNSLPDLTNLDNGDLKYSVDFKQVYATILDRWLDTDDVAVLGKQYSKLEFL